LNSSIEAFDIFHSSPRSSSPISYAGIKTPKASQSAGEPGSMLKYGNHSILQSSPIPQTPVVVCQPEEDSVFTVGSSMACMGNSSAIVPPNRKSLEKSDLLSAEKVEELLHTLSNSKLEENSFDKFLKTSSTLMNFNDEMSGSFMEVGEEGILDMSIGSFAFENSQISDF